jgi:hypothetical protein
VCYENRIKYINATCGQNVEVFNCKGPGTCCDNLCFKRLKRIRANSSCLDIQIARPALFYVNFIP